MVSYKVFIDQQYLLLLMIGGLKRSIVGHVSSCPSYCVTQALTDSHRYSRKAILIYAWETINSQATVSRREGDNDLLELCNR